MKKILITQILLYLVFIGCKRTDRKGASICGYAMNGGNLKIVLYVNDQALDSTVLGENNEFCLKIDTLTDGLYNFRIGKEYQYLYLEQGNSIALSTNMLNFDETLAFSGKGSKINNFILSMYAKSEKDKAFINNYYFLSPAKFTEKVDSLYEIRQKDLADFKIRNTDVAEDVWELAEISATYDLLAVRESYAQFYKNFNSNTVKDSLPKDYYEYRKNISANSNFAYHRSFFNYAQAFINNEAYSICSKNEKHLGLKGKDHYHFHKLKLIDSIYGKNNILRDNLYRNAAYAYLFNLSDESKIGEYIHEMKDYIKDNRYKRELDSLFAVAENLEKGKELSNIEVLNVKSKSLEIKSLLFSKVNVLYFISPKNVELSQLIENRILQLKTLFPKAHYIGIAMGGDYNNWRERYLKNNQSLNEYYAKDPMKVSQKFLFYNPNKIVIVDKNGAIIDAFGNIFSSKTEKNLAGYLD